MDIHLVVKYAVHHGKAVYCMVIFNNNNNGYF